MVNCARFKSLCEALYIEGHLFASTWGKEAHLLALQSNIRHNDNSETNSANSANNSTITTTNNINSSNGQSNGGCTRSNGNTDRNDNK